MAVAHGLLGVADAGHVALPREIGLHLRGGRVHSETLREAPPLQAAETPAALVDRAAGSAAAEVLRLVGELLESWSAQPPPAPRSGGLGVREAAPHRHRAGRRRGHRRLRRRGRLRRRARGRRRRGGAGVGADPGLRRLGGGGPRDGLGAARRRVVHVHPGAWPGRARGTTATPSADSLSPELDRPLAREVRSRVLAELATTPPGTAPDLASLLERLRRRRPRRTGRMQEDLVRWTLREAELLGVTGGVPVRTRPRAGRACTRAGQRHGLPPGRGDGPAAAGAGRPRAAPGGPHRGGARPAGGALGRLMALPPTSSPAAARRCTGSRAPSVRRALDAGGGAELVGALAAGSRTPVPQPLSTWSHDVARRHGRVRVGRPASAYVRSDDESTLRELLSDRRAASLRLRQLAPTVLAPAQACHPSTVLAVVLREVGLRLRRSPRTATCWSAGRTRTAPRHG